MGQVERGQAGLRKGWSQASAFRPDPNPIPELVSLALVSWTCNSDFASADLRSPFGTVGTYPEVTPVASDTALDTAKYRIRLLISAQSKHARCAKAKALVRRWSC